MYKDVDGTEHSIIIINYLDTIWMIRSQNYHHASLAIIPMMMVMIIMTAMKIMCIPLFDNLIFYHNINYFFVSVSYLQIGGERESGDGDPTPTFIINTETSRFYSRSGLRGTAIQGRISHPPSYANIYEWLHSSLEDLHHQLCSEYDESDFIGLTINSKRFARGSVWLSFRPIRQFTANDLWDLMYKAVHSNEGFNIDDSLAINCAIVRGMAGHGRVKLTEETVCKRSILTIKNTDRLCLPRPTTYSISSRS